MVIYDTIKLMQEYARIANKYCMYISWQEDVDIYEIYKAAPYLEGTNIPVYTSFEAVLTFDTEEEMDKHYDMTVGDDGPTKLNNYNGPVRVYALTCSNKGELWTENT